MENRKDITEIHVNKFHLFYWLNAVPTSSFSRKRSLADEEEKQERKEGISIMLDNQRMEQSLSQMQAYIEKKNGTGRRAYAQCPSRSLDEVECHVNGATGQRRKTIFTRPGKGDQGQT